MNKQCKNCGSNIPGDAKFCQMCGGSDFVNVDFSKQTIFNQNMTNPQQTNSGWQPPIPKDASKKKKTGLVIGIVVAVLIVLAVIGMVAEKAFQEQGYGDAYNDESNMTSDSEQLPDKIYYSKGEFDGSVYTNNWANLKYVLPEGFSNADLATYSAAENSNTECGFYFMADDTMSLIYVSFEKLPSFPVYNEEKYLDTAMKSLEAASGVTYKIPDTYSTATIAGQSYTKAECEFNNSYGNFANTFFVRKLDNYMICISVIGINTESNDVLVSNMTTAR